MSICRRHIVQLLGPDTSCASSPDQVVRLDSDPPPNGPSQSTRPGSSRYAAVPSSQSRPGTAYNEIGPCFIQPVRNNHVAGGLVGSGS